MPAPWVMRFISDVFREIDIEAPRRETILDALYETHPPRDVRLRNPDMLQIDRR